ncbi:MAG TPA: glycosyltransferase, partial [Nonomuraea sp.]|nr:glycosyltransferase [Nonomuraea sp.]
MSEPVPTPSVAVVVLHYERPHLLSECLRSVDENDFAEVGPRIVVDNASPGGPPDLPAGWVLVQADRNGGYGAGMNLGIGHAGQADYVLLLTHDVVLRPACIRELVTHSMEAGPLTLSGPLLFDRAQEAVFSSGGEVRGIRWALPHRRDAPPPHE